MSISIYQLVQTIGLQNSQIISLLSISKFYVFWILYNRKKKQSRWEETNWWYKYYIWINYLLICLYSIKNLADAVSFNIHQHSIVQLTFIKHRNSKKTCYHIIIMIMQMSLELSRHDPYCFEPYQSVFMVLITIGCEIGRIILGTTQRLILNIIPT